MWQCSNCGESVEDTFDICWNCGASADGTINPEFDPEPDDPAVPDPGPDSSSKVSQRQMNWLSISKFLNVFAFCAGIAMGIANSYPPVPLPDWRLLATFMTIGLLVFPFMIIAVIRFHAFIKSGIEVEPPRLDRCFISLSRPLDTLLFAAHLAFWQGLGVFLTGWICWPHNFLLGVSMILGYYSILFGIRLTLTKHAKHPVRNTT